MKNILDKIFADKKEEMNEARRKYSLSELRSRTGDAPPCFDIFQALDPKRWETSRVITELKRKTPFKGELRKNFDLIAITEDYFKNGAAAISVLTEMRNFGGSLDFLTLIRGQVDIPVLRKDFIFHEYQVYESRVFGADSFLLIATCLEKNQLLDLLELGKELGLLALVETHNEKDMEKALGVEAQLIGINNRDLTTGKTNLDISRRLLERYRFESNCIVICESGFRTRNEIEEFEKRGAHAFLIGESLMVSEDIPAKLKGLISQTKNAHIR